MTLTFYWGAASGSARAALRQLKEPNVAINYATKLNEPWDGIDRLFIDSGGYSFLKGKGEYETSDAEYLDYIQTHQPERFALRDYPCETDIRKKFNRTVTDHQQKTTSRHISLLDEYEDRDLDTEPVAVLQGWHASEYVEHLEQLRSQGCLTSHVAIGTLCGRESAATIRNVVTRVREALPSSHTIHAFGVKLDAFREPGTVEAIDSADSNAFDADERRERTRGGDRRGRSWQDVAFYYLKHKRKIRERITQKKDPEPSWLRDEKQRGLEEIA